MYLHFIAGMIIIGGACLLLWIIHMADLALHGGGQRRLSHAQMRELKRQMKLAQRKLDGMQGLIEMEELSEDIAAENLLEQLKEDD